jgi:hypothetical protein
MTTAILNRMINIQNTAREAQPVSWDQIEAVINSNQRRYNDLPNIKCGVESGIKETRVSWLPEGWSYANSDFRATPLSLALLATDPLYEISSPNTRRSLEKEAGMEMVLEFDTLYNKYNGKSRKWIKTHLNTELGKAAAGATDQPFNWTGLLDKNKVLSAVIDFICVKYGIRISIWWSEHKKLCLWPIEEEYIEYDTPIMNIEVLTSGEAHVLKGPNSDPKIKPSQWLSLFKTIGEWQWIRPPTCPSISGKTLTELRSEYSEIVGDNEAERLSKKIDKETLANLIYKTKWLETQLIKKESDFS